MLREISQTEKDKHCVVPLIRRILKKKKQVKLIETDRGLVAAWGPGRGGPVVVVISDSAGLLTKTLRWLHSFRQASHPSIVKIV